MTANIIKLTENIVYKLIFQRFKKKKIKRSLIRAFQLKNIIDIYIDRLVISYYDGKHPKHHLWKYHYKFIIDNINQNDKVLDIGCGKSLSYGQELSSRVDFLDAIDINEDLINSCLKSNKHNNINYYKLDITKELPTKSYDVVILSHVLEHLKNPLEVLQNIRKITKKIIVRLPRYDDHWHYLVKKDLGLFYYKDRDHKKEFILETAKKLVQDAGWDIKLALNDIDIKILATIKS